MVKRTGKCFTVSLFNIILIIMLLTSGITPAISQVTIGTPSKAGPGFTGNSGIIFNNMTININATSEGDEIGNIKAPDDITGLTDVLLMEGYIREDVGIRDRPGVLIPVPGAAIYFIRSNVIMARTVSNPVGFYSVSIPPGDYTVVVAAPGFQTEIRPFTLDTSQTLNIGLIPLPFNGFVPYALYPVLETSPGREVTCSIVVENFQVIDQMVTFTAVTPPEWQAWFPVGEATMVRSGASSVLTFTLKYVGNQQGPHVMKVVVNGGAYFAEVPIIVVVKDLPFEKIDFYSNSPERIVKPGTVATFILTAFNKYAQDKTLSLNITKPNGWSATTGNGTTFFLRDEEIASTNFYVYVPSGTTPGDYFVNVTLCGEGVQSDTARLRITVEGSPLYDAIVKGYPAGEGGYPVVNLTEGQPFELPVRIYNNWDFPLVFLISAEVGDNWPFYISGAPIGRVRVEPGKASEFVIRSKVPNGTAGNYTARVYIETDGQQSTLITLLNVQPAGMKYSKDMGAAVLTVATAATMLFSLVMAARRKIR